MTTARLSPADLRRLRVWQEFYCQCCGRPFKVQGIDTLCGHCRTWTEKYGLPDTGEASGS